MYHSDELSDAPLSAQWTIWFDRQPRRKGKSNQQEDCIVELGTVSTEREFGAYWESLRVEQLRDCCNLRIFRTGVKPLWEDPMNANGGKWVVRNVAPTRRSDMWGSLARGLIRDELVDCSTNTVSGVVLSKRDGGDSLQVWVDGGCTAASTGAAAALSAQRSGLPTMDVLLGARLAPWIGSAAFVFQTHRELQRSRGRTQPQPEQPQLQQGAAGQLQQQVEQQCVSPCTQQAYDTQVVHQPYAAPYASQFAPSVTYTSPTLIAPHGVVQMQCMQQGVNMCSPQQPPCIGTVTFPVPNAEPMIQQVPMMMQGAPQQYYVAAVNAGSPVTPSVVETASPPSDGHGAELTNDSQCWGEACDLPPENMTPEMQALHERAKQIRMLRKKVRYVSFFLARQTRGRELTPQEANRVRSLPQLQQDLRMLEEQQAFAVEQQKRQLGVETADFMRKRQQPMTYNSEEERRFKTMRAIRKKIRFVHYHLERQRAGKALSPAEQAKVSSLPELEGRLRALEAEEREYRGDQYPAESEQPPVSVDTDEPGTVEALCAQIEAQKQELEAKQRHIDMLLRQQSPGNLSPLPGGMLHCSGDYASPVPPPACSAAAEAGCGPAGELPVLESPPMSPPLSPSAWRHAGLYASPPLSPSGVLA
eukprot:TRINITY_DN5228_c0_g1_i2.p1 TRINITY_DN5228_c0_g1~~TRINITY_DN5228_c0_g1_i2.p1  ORF type:complete len:673 (+),score=231.41 TRINITY_DN5228_c0_g1_i2:85-2019(+)